MAGDAPDQQDGHPQPCAQSTEAPQAHTLCLPPPDCSGSGEGNPAGTPAGTLPGKLCLENPAGSVGKLLQQQENLVRGSCDLNIQK